VKPKHLAAKTKPGPGHVPPRQPGNPLGPPPPHPRLRNRGSPGPTLIGQGDHGLALQIIQPGLLRHPASSTLAGLRATALHRLMEQYQQTDPFKFLIYAELGGAEIGPVQ
jgi:hypothetical protein